MKSKRLLGVLLLLAFGVVRMPLESGLTEKLRAQGLKESPPELSWQEDFGEMFMATLGGLRNLVASVYYLKAYTAFEVMDWGTVDNQMALVTRMQPKEAAYWDEAAWHMAYNAASSFKRDKELRAAIQNKLFRDHVQKGIEILNKGLQYLPNNRLLLEKLGDIYRDRQPNAELAADAYLRAFQNGGRTFLERMAAYEMVKTGNVKLAAQAYEILKRYYDMGPSFARRQRIVDDLKILEDRLNIPAEKRIRPGPTGPPPASRSLPGPPTPRGD